MHIAHCTCGGCHQVSVVGGGYLPLWSHVQWVSTLLDIPPQHTLPRHTHLLDIPTLSKIHPLDKPNLLVLLTPWTYPHPWKGLGTRDTTLMERTWNQGHPPTPVNRMIDSHL